MAITIDPLVAFLYQPVAALPSLSHQARGSYTLQPGEILEIVVPADGSCTHQVRQMGSHAPITYATTTGAATQLLGPYNVVAEVELQAMGPDTALNIARRNR